ncbi:MAG: POTRA domain-containing protein, partial [Bacteroidota bacterium]
MRNFIGLILLMGLGVGSLHAQIRNYNIPSRTTTPSQPAIDYQQPQEYEIAEITVSGARYLDQNALISLSGLQVGDKVLVPGPDITKAIENLWSQGLLEDVRIYATKIELGKIYLNIELKELPRLTRYVFEGISQSREKEIDDEIELLRGRIITDALVKNTRLLVENYFTDKGFRNITVNIIQEVDSLITNGKQLRIQIDKGDKVYIDRINLIGNEAFSDTRLKLKIKKTKEQVRFNIFEDLFGRLVRWNWKDLKDFDSDSSRFSVEDVLAWGGYHIKLNFFNGSKLIQTQYDEDVQGLISFYNSKGYRDAEIVADSVYDVENNRINIDLTIDEGPKYYIRNILWSGNFLYTDEQLGGLLGIEKGEVYNKDRIDQRLQFDPQERDISALYLDDGYLFFNVQPVEVGIYGDSIDIQMQIYEGQQATINRVMIAGNDRTKDHVILREIRTLPGQKFSRANLIRTQRELSNLGYFDPEQMGIVPIPNQADGTVDMQYTLVERPNDQIELSGGWGGFAGFVGTVGLVFNN